ncbi:MAG: EamA family transporter [Firmicutes bacterium]|nr:EamA family transporter [Bacillota bacterium]
MKNKGYLQGYLFVAIAGSLWGIGGFFVTKMSDAGASSLMTAFGGHFLALPPLLLYLLAKKGKDGLKISKQGLLVSILLGVLTKGIFKLALDTSMILVGIATSTILMYLAPVWTAIMAVIFFKEKLRSYQVFALLLNLIGCTLVITGGIVFSSIATAIFAKPWENLDLLLNGTFFFWAITGAVLSGAVANIFFLTGLSMGIDASKATIVASVEVVVATLAGVLLLSEQINSVGYSGILVMLGSIILMNVNIPK